MKVFLCWSGKASHQIAQALFDFIGDVIQDVKPFLSSESVRKGQRWNAEIACQLSDTNYGIVCLTKDNLDARWILFESGALSKNMTEGRVTAFLVGVQPTDVLEPLSQFQQTRADREDIFILLKDLNDLLPDDRRLTSDRLTRLFNSEWTGFKAKLQAAAKLPDALPGVARARDTRDMIAELLELVREMKREMKNERAIAQRSIEARAMLQAFGHLDTVLKTQDPDLGSAQTGATPLAATAAKLTSETLNVGKPKDKAG
jgi:hypothetical protein